MPIASDERAYRRGVVFGFTVAEVVLLLVFCLLLLFMPLMLAEAERASAARRANEAANATARDSARGRPTIGDPSANRSRSAQRPLPDGWVRISPDAASNAEQPSPTQSHNDARSKQNEPAVSQSGKAPSGPHEALTLKGACERMGIPLSECTVISAEDRLRALARANIPSKSDGQHDWPPIISLKEADKEFFSVGRAEVSAGLARKIQGEVVEKILDLVSKYQTKVVEVIGHTDEQPVYGGASNLDSTVLDFLNKGGSAANLRASDNAGLGYARAVAIVQILAQDPRLAGLTILPLSAAQAVTTEGKISDGAKGGDVKERRRIEIRVRQSE